MRVLHLIDGGFPAGRVGPDPDGAMAACRLLLERAGGRQLVCILGPGAAVRRAGEIGLPVDVAIAPSLGLPEAGWRALRRWVDANGRPEVVLAWGPRPARLALRALGDLPPTVAVLDDGGWAPAAVAVTFCEAARVRLASQGMVNVRVVPPPVVAVNGAADGAAALRERLGIGADAVLVAQLGRAPQAEGIRFAFLIGLLRVAGSPATGLLAPLAAQQPRMARFLRHRDWLPIVQQNRAEEWRDVLAACDLAVFDGGGPGPTADWPPAPWAGAEAIAAAHACGVPVVAPAWAAAPGLYPDGAAALCLAENSTLPELARRLTPLIADAALRRRLSVEVRKHAAGMDSASRFVEGVRRAWEDAVQAAEAPGHG